MSVDVLLATYNSGDFLEPQLESLLNQTYQDFSLLIRDGGSSDSTVNLLEKYQERYPGKIKLIPSEGRSGFLKNFRELMLASSADYIFFCDHDDIWLPGKIEKCLKRIQAMSDEYGSGVPLCVHCDMILADGECNQVKPSVHKAWNFGRTPELDGYPVDIPCFGCTMVINKTLKDKALPMDDVCASHDTWCGRIAWYMGKIDFIDEPLMKYRVHTSNVSCNSTDAYPAALFNHLKKFKAARKKLADNIIEPCNEFIGKFAEQLPEYHKKRLTAVSSWKKHWLFCRLFLMLRYNIHSNGLLRTIGLLFL